MNVLFLHTPKFHNYYKPIGDFTFVLFPPIGLLGLADFLRKQGHTAKIIHLGVEQHVAGELDFKRIVEEHRPALIGLDLHWHFQSYDAIEVARQIKHLHPHIPILLGGFTASLFAEEILAGYPFIDFVIRGDAEIPLLQLVHEISSGKNYSAVPNLAFRNGSEIVVNPISFTADGAFLDSLCFTDFTLMRDYSVFVDSFSRYQHSPDLSERFQQFLFGHDKCFQVYIGRGCVHDCSYCGGSSEAHRLLARRETVAIRSAPSIVSSIQDLVRFGFNSACLALDSFPLAQADDTYIAIFEELQRLKITLHIEVERYFLPTLPFIQSFSRLAGKKSFVTLSPHTHNEELRQRNGLHRYPNRALESCLDSMESHGVNSLLCFTCGLPFETEEDLQAMARYQRHLRKKYRRMRFKTCMIEIEPGSAMSRCPASFGLTLDRSTFAEYYRYHSQPRQNHWQEMGYSRQGCPSHPEVSAFFCRHFCERFHAGWASPMVCNSLELLWKAGAFRAADRVFRHF